MFQKIKALFKKVYFFSFKILTFLFQIRNDVVMLESNLGRNYSGNPKYIYEEMILRGLDKRYMLIWIVEDKSIDIPGKCKKIRKSRLLYSYFSAIARFWVYDCRQAKLLEKRNGSIHIQTWHGTPIKKIGLDLEVLNMSGMDDVDGYKRNFFNESRDWDYLLSQNSYSCQIFRRAFAFEKDMIEVGYPRNDILINGNHGEHIGKLKRQFGLPMNRKIILYAPTWRDDEYHEKGRYKFNVRLDLKSLHEIFKDDYAIVLKMHYLVADSMDLSDYEGFAFLCDPKVDIQELYLVSDIMITDYSSVMFDYSILRRPMLFFAFDMEKYRDEIRGFYFDFTSVVPGPVVTTNEALIEEIKQVEFSYYERYGALYDEFVKKFNPWDDGKASSKIVDFIEGKRAAGDWH